MISQLEFFITETFISLRRHPAMAFAAITCVASALFVAGMVGLVIANAQYAVEGVKNNVRFIVWFHPETTPDAAKLTFARVKTLANVDGEASQFVSRDKPWESLRKKDPGMWKLIGRNPFPDHVEVKARSIEAIPGLVETIQKWPEVDTVRYSADVSRILINITAGISKIGGIAGIILIILALVIIHHTIELTLYARRREIFIMSLVGATPATIAMPFLLEGIIYGVIGGVVGVGCVYALYLYIVSSMVEYSASLQTNPVILGHGALYLLLGGIGLGFLGSLVSVLKYLNRPRSRVTNA